MASLRRKLHPIPHHLSQETEQQTATFADQQQHAGTLPPALYTFVQVQLKEHIY